MRKTKSLTFKLHYNRLGHKRGDPDVWTILVSGRCIHVRHVDVSVPVATVFKGDTAPQPRAYLQGKGIVSVRNGTATIRGET